MRKLSLFITLLLLLLSPLHVKAQGIFNLNHSNLQSIEEVSDSQIEKLVSQMEENGLSLDEVLNIARTKGATQTQLRDLEARIKDFLEKKEEEQNEKQLLEGSNTIDAIIDSTLFSQKVNIDSLDIEKQPFGFQFFNTENLNFASNLNTPLSEDYIIGVGDNIHINVYGVSQRDYALQVGKNRAINIPNIGPVYIGGLSIAEAKKLIKTRLSSIYNGMQGNHPNTFVSINVVDISGINVNVIGEANRPGTYTLPATANVFNALYLAGGPGANGSFREIDIVRDGKTVATTDVYHYLINGDTRGNIQLRNNDVILIKPYLHRVFVEGAFKRQGIFEAKPGETVADVIRFAGGFTANAYNKQVSLTRNNSRTLSFKTITAEQYESTPILNGDQIESGKVVELYENRVSISGAVYRPGNYELTDGLTLKQLIENAEGLRDDAFVERAIITRKLDNLELKTISFSVKDILEGKENITLRKEDNVIISSIFDMREDRTVEIVGAVQSPGTFSYSENMTVQDLIFLAGGFKEKASISNIEIARRLNYDEAEEYSDNLIHTYTISVDRNLQLISEDKDMVLMPFDHVYVRNAPGLNQGQGSVTINGEVKYTGSYSISNKQERISDIIERAGGLTPEAYIQGISLQRREILSDAQYQSKVKIAEQDSTMNVKEITREEYKTVAINLKDIMSDKRSGTDLMLQDGDQIFVPAKMQTIAIKGAVLNEVSLTYDKKLSAYDYIRLSGGFANNAKKNKVYVVYPNGEAHATRCFIFRNSPKVVPGAEIIVPEKPQIDRTGQAQRWIGIGSGIAGIAASLAAIISITK
ncbi:protein involved in polysaccharide export with SLBB domain [Balneicella halophila]|uniref:Protein involved in polysaccharide export with SLBB domain n=1 Tax=Balneicella halophila TaxID=1537566 RepID=A0A7L4UT63_BALHA|nr:SLBB domain-containing protein [Balneicella halophila]PVX52254.1 protein involved in polysaccharide export with SLBB domain [Balneicella halophila]